MHVNIKRICVPTDFSPCSEQAIHYGATLAEVHDADLHLLHVLQDAEDTVLHPDFTASGEQARDYFRRLEEAEGGPEGESASERKPDEDERIHNYLRALEKGVDSKFAKLELDKWWERVRLHRVIRYGNPVREICRYTRKHSIDLLILGTHGRTGLSQLLLGSVAERVVRVSPCPVLTVRHPAHDFIVEDSNNG